MTEPSEPVVNDLEAAMVALRRDSSRADEFFDLLARCELYIPQDRDPRELGTDEVLLPVAGQGERKGVPAFSSKERLLQRGGGHWMAIRGCDLSRLWEPGALLLLNPGSDISAEISPEEVLDLARRRIASPETMPHDTRISIGEPAYEPRALLEAVARFARVHPQVEAAYRALIEPHGAGFEAFPAVGLRLEPGVNEEEILRKLTEAVTPVAAGRVTLLTIRDDTDDPIASYMLEESRPFYERDRHGGAVRPVLVVVTGSRSASH